VIHIGDQITKSKETTTLDQARKSSQRWKNRWPNDTVQRNYKMELQIEATIQETIGRAKNYRTRLMR